MASEAINHYQDILIVLGTAGIVIPLFLRFGIGSILGFLIVGLVLGPHVLGALTGAIPVLANIGIAKPDAIAGLAEFGVVFLLFLIGLELSPERLMTMRRLVFGLGGLQVLLSLAAISVGALVMGFTEREAIILGMALCLSSTAIVVQIFSDDKRLGSQAGRTSFAILLLQDLAVIPMLLLVGIMASPDSDNIAGSIAMALLQALAAALVIVLAGRFALRPILKLVAAAHSPDLFMAAVLFIAIGTGAIATAAGLSMSLGAFIAGLMLAETEYRRAVEAIIEPFKGLLLGLFFLLVGLGLDLGGLAEHPLQVLALAASLVLLKAFITYALARLFRVSHLAALEAALLLGPCGEFAFVILGAAAAAGLLQHSTSATVLLIVSLTMMAIPLLSKSLKPALHAWRADTPAAPELPAMPGQAEESRVIIAGFGRVGSLIAAMLDEHKIPFIAIDHDVQNVAAARKNGVNIFYGDAGNPEFLQRCGIDQARALAITMDNPTRADEIVRVARKNHPDLKIIARARDERHAIRLYGSGVTEAVPETIESSLQLGEALLVETGVPMGLAIASVHERRDGFRKLLGRPNRRDDLGKARRRLRNRLPK